jgi:hypothetical protein
VFFVLAVALSWPLGIHVALVGSRVSFPLVPCRGVLFACETSSTFSCLMRIDLTDRSLFLVAIVLCALMRIDLTDRSLFLVSI